MAVTGHIYPATGYSTSFGDFDASDFAVHPTGDLGGTEVTTACPGSTCRTLRTLRGGNIIRVSEVRVRSPDSLDFARDS